MERYSVKTIQEAFAPQMEGIPEYIAAGCPDHKITAEQLKARFIVMYEAGDGSIPSDEKLDEMVQVRLADLAAHPEQTKLYYLFRRPDNNFEILSVWSGDIDALAATHYMAEQQDGNLPWLKLKVT